MTTAVPDPAPATLAAGADLTHTVHTIRAAIAERMRALPADNAGLLLDAQLHAEAAQRAAQELGTEIGILFGILAQVGGV